MSLDKKVLASARAELERRKAHHEAELERRTQLVYSRAPEVRRLDGELRGTMARTVSAALSSGSDPVKAVELLEEENLRLQRERIDAIVRAGFPKDYLDGEYMCPKCRDTGYDGTKICSCLHEIYMEEQRKGLSSLLRLGGESFDSFELRWYDDTPDPDTGISPRMNMENVYEFCVLYARRFGANSSNMLFSGQTGLGKTFLSACIARVVAEKGFSVVYESASAVFNMFECARFDRGDDPDAARAYIRRCMECDLFILDDLGTEMTTAFTTGVLYELVNTRLINGKKTIISTNLNISAIRARYTPQIASRLEGEYQLLSFFGRDIRLLKKEL